MFFIDGIAAVVGTISFAFTISVGLAQQGPNVDAGPPFGMLPLIDEIVVGDNEDEHAFIESSPGASEILDVAGRPTRIT